MNNISSTRGFRLQKRKSQISPRILPTLLADRMSAARSIDAAGIPLAWGTPRQHGYRMPAAGLSSRSLGAVRSMSSSCTTLDLVMKR